MTLLQISYHFIADYFINQDLDHRSMDWEKRSLYWHLYEHHPCPLLFQKKKQTQGAFEQRYSIADEVMWLEIIELKHKKWQNWNHYKTNSSSQCGSSKQLLSFQAMCYKRKKISSFYKLIRNFSWTKLRTISQETFLFDWLIKKVKTQKEQMTRAFLLNPVI